VQRPGEEEEEERSKEQQKPREEERAARRTESTIHTVPELLLLDTMQVEDHSFFLLWFLPARHKTFGLKCQVK